MKRLKDLDNNRSRDGVRRIQNEREACYWRTVVITD